MSAEGIDRSSEVSAPATTARLSLPTFPPASVATAWRRFVPGVTGTVAANVPSPFTTAATSFTVTDATTPLSSVAVPVTTTVLPAPANVPRAGDVM